MDLGTLFAKISLDSKEFSKGLDKTLSGLSAITTASGVASTALAGLFVAATAEGLRFAAQLEQLQMGFSTLLGSSSAASDFISSMQEFAARTPFQFEDVTQGARRLMAMGVAADDTLPLLSAIGDRVSAMGGGAFEIQRVITALGQMNAKTRVATQEINQLTEVGISGFGILAKELGKTVPEVIGMVEAREIDSATFLKAFMHTTSDEVGGMMERQATTLIGLVSTLKDRVSMGLADAAKPMIEPLKQAIPVVTDFVGNVIDAVGPLISGLGDVVGVVSQALSAFNALDTETQGAILALGTLATVAPAAITGLIAGIGGLVQAASGLVPVFTVVGTVASAAFSPEIFLTFAAAALIATSVVQQAADDMWSVFSQDGEGALDTLDRIGTNIMNVLGPAFGYVAAASEQFMAGFNVASMETQVSFERIAKGVELVVDQVLTFISVMTGTDLGAEKWAVVGEWVGKLLLKLSDVAGSVGSAVITWVLGFTSVMGPLIVSVGEFVDGLLGIVTGTYDAGTAFEKMMSGFVGVLETAFIAVVAIVGGTIAVVLDLLSAGLKAMPGMSQLPGAEQAVGTMTNVATQIRETMGTLGSDMMAGIAKGGVVSLDSSTFNMETDAAATALGGFNMETDAAAAATKGYRGALDDLMGVLSEATGKAKKTTAAKAPKAKQYDPFEDTAAAMGMTEAEMKARIEELMPPPVKPTVYGALEDSAAAFGMTVDEFKARTEELDQANKDRLKSEEDTTKALDQFAASIAGKITSAMGKLGTLINSTVSGFQSGGVWGALIAALVELLINSETMANISATLDEVFGRISDAFGQLLVGIHMVVGNVLLLVAQIVDGLAPVFQLVSDVFAGLSPLLIILGVVVGMVVEVISRLLAPLKQVMAIITSVFSFVFDVFKSIATVLVQVLGTVANLFSSLLAPVQGLLEMVLPMLEVGFTLLGSVLGMLLKPLSLVISIVSLTLQPLEYAFSLFGAAMGWLAEKLAWVGEKIIGFILVVEEFWNSLIDKLIGIVEKLASVFGGLDGLIEKLGGMKADTSATEEALQSLTDMTYESALAQAEQNVTVQDTTESLDAMNAALINVPSGYKVALARFGAMAAGLGGVFGSYSISDIQIPAMASGGVTLGPTLALVGEAGPEAVIPLDRLSQMMRAGGGAGVVITGNIYVTAPDPEAFLTELERIGKRRAANTRGNPMAIQTPFAGVRR